MRLAVAALTLSKSPATMDNDSLEIFFRRKMYSKAVKIFSRLFTGILKAGSVVVSKMNPQYCTACAGGTHFPG
jgi:hypothetical protein